MMSRGADMGQGRTGDSSWSWETGWNGLVPGRSVLKDVLDRLGDPEGESEMANGRCFDFFNGTCRITFLNGNPVVSKIWVSIRLSRFDLIPFNIDQAVERFGELKATRVDREHGVIFEKPGLRIASDPQTEPEAVNWIELFCPDPG